MNKTYSERIQATYFVAARDLFRLAATVLNEVTQPEEFRGSTAEWSKLRAKAIVTQAYELETRGHEQCIASNHANSANERAKQEFSQAVSRHQRLVAEYGKVAV